MKNSLTKMFYLAIFIAVFQITSVFAGATLTVNDPFWVDNCDDELSLEEAYKLGESTFHRALTSGEKNQISNATFIATPPPPGCTGVGWTVVTGLGSDFADDIVFTNDVGLLNMGSITLGKNDSINGLKPNGQKVIFENANNCPLCAVIYFDGASSGSQVRNLVIRNFSGSAISVYGPDGARFEGLEIYGNGNNGIMIQPHPAASKNPRNITIGGPAASQQNKIYSNGGTGIVIIANSTYDRANENILIQNNLIGTSDGTTDNGNTYDGIYLENTIGVTIGDSAGLTRNIISGNNQNGIRLAGARCVSTKIIWNFIGTTNSGAGRLGNSWDGVVVSAAAGSAAGTEGVPNQIGMAGLGNVISDNYYGVVISDNNTAKNRVQGNYIGTNTGANTDVGNFSDGIMIRFGSSDNLIGGTGTGEGNFIAYNRNGIYVESGTRNQFRQNRITSNDSLGIDLAPTGVTANDSGDGDSGPNDLQNFPVITYLNAQTSSVNIQGTFNSTANQTFSLEFFGNPSADGTGYGEGRNFLGSTPVTTNGSGNATFNSTFPVSLSTVGQRVTATATNSTGSTSEYSLARYICANLSLSPAGVVSGSSGGSSSFNVSTSSGCSYSPLSSDSWITVSSISGGTVNFTISPNTGAQRIGSILVSYNNGTFVTYETFTVSQSAGCTFSLNATSINFAAAGGSGGVNVTAAGGCAWTAASNAAWITISGGSSGNGNGTVNYSVLPNTGAARQGTMTIAGQTFTVNQSAATSSHAQFDFDGDGKTDAAVYRPSAGDWYLLRSTAGFGAFHFGSPSDIFVPADYTGDGKTDMAVFRPSSSIWYVLRSENYTFYGAGFGASGDIPSPGDFDGDGKADTVVFRPSNGTWYMQRSTAGFNAVQFGQNGDVPAAGDFDGDGKNDISVYRPSLGNWYRLNSGNGSFYGVHFGLPGDMIVPADYTGDGKTDLAVFRPSTSYWYVYRSEDNSFYGGAFGSPGDLPSPGDYDGDGRADIAVWRPGTQSIFYIMGSTSGFLVIPWGIAEDRPVANAYVY